MKKYLCLLGALVLIAVCFLILKPAADLFYAEEEQLEESVQQPVIKDEPQIPVAVPEEILQEEPKPDESFVPAENPVTLVVPEEPVALQEDVAPSYIKYVAPISAYAEELNKEGATTQDDLGIIESMLNYSMKVYKHMPVAADNQEFVSHLIGKNKKGVQILAHDHPAINEEGKLVDRWGTPYFFHPMSEKLVELRSAGPDGILFNEDDITL